jgi:Right handed beta helix region
MCFQWREGHDEIPVSWKEYYRLHPCVPIDYSTIPKALAVVTHKRSPATNNSNGVSQYIRSNSQSKKEQTQSLDVLLRPGKHIIKESIVVVAAANDITVSLKTMELPPNRFYSPRLAFAEQAFPRSFPESKPKSRTTTFGEWIGCKSATSVIDGNNSGVSDAESNVYDSDSSENSLLFLRDDNRRGGLSIQETNRISTLNTASASMFMPPVQYPQRATIVLRTRRQNEPIFLVRQGSFRLSNVNLDHGSHGVDIWNGNAALHVQPPLGVDNEPVPVFIRPSATLDNVIISSKSGRGVVCLDGGSVTLRACMIHDCAATGLYIGGPGSEADMSTTDVIRNGVGSRLPPSRAPRVTSGHSGVYLEQGVARIRECNISSNHLTGISVVSIDNAILLLKKSDLVANGNGNLEMPPPGSTSHGKSEVSNDNNLASVGRPCLRSNLELPDRIRPRASF